MKLSFQCAQTGQQKSSFVNAIYNGKSGIKPIEGIDVSSLTTKIAGQVLDFRPEDYFEKKNLEEWNGLPNLLQQQPKCLSWELLQYASTLYGE